MRSSNQTSGNSSERVPLKTKIGWGMGGLADHFMFNSLGILILPIYNIGLGLDVFLVGLASGIPRVLDAFSDTLVGNISDNARTRWGRRRPFIALGTVSCVCLFPLFWMPPFQSQYGIFLYLLGMAFIYFSCAYTVFVIPYTALGYEQASDYNEKTRVLAWRMYLGLIGALTVPWLYKLCLLDIFPNEVVGVRFISIGIGLIILVTGLAPVFVCKEKIDHRSQSKVSIKRAFAETFRNKAFMRLISVYILIILGIFSGMGLALYLNIYYICDGNKEYAAKLVATAGSIMALMSYISLPAATWISAKIGKHQTMLLGLLITSIGAATYWLTLRPEWPELQYVSAAIIGCSLQGCWLMVNSMIADICDEDEFSTGLRREGFYAAVLSLCRKVSLGLVQVMIGGLLWLFGFDIQLAKEGLLDPTVQLRLYHGFILLQFLTPLAGIWVLRKFPLTQDRMQEIRADLKHHYHDRDKAP